MPRLVGALRLAARDDPAGRKLLVGTRRGVGREILRRLARDGVPWIGFEATTPLALASDLVAPTLAERGLEPADEFDELARIDAAIEAAVGEPDGSTLLPFVEGAGLRAAMANSIQALRLAGIVAAVLGRAGFRDRRKREAIARVLVQYERLLLADSRMDAAGILRLAHDELRLGTKTLPDARIFLLPGQDRRGWSGAMLALLQERGATLLEDDPVFGLQSPPAILDSSSGHHGSSQLSWLHAVNDAPVRDSSSTLELFAACSVSDEVREVLRRAVANGLHWDEIEVVATDAVAYGAAMDSLARRLGIPVTYASGLPVGRTRAGRAVDAYLRWIRDDFAEDVLRAALERGDIAPPGGGHGTPGPALARRLRSLSIGRGRERYFVAIERARSRPERAVPDDEDLTAEDRAAAIDSERRTLDDLAAILEPVLRATPTLPERIKPHVPIVSPAALAAGLLEWLALVPVDVDDMAKKRLLERLTRLAAVALRPTTLEAAISIVAAKLDTRVPASTSTGAAPWSSTGGFLHVSDIEHGGHTGRRATFVTGLDAMRFPGGGAHDTLLGDEERRRLLAASSFAPIPTSSERLQERRWHLARLLSRLRGSITLSYSAWEATEARAVAPAAEMLQGFRLRCRDVTANYEAMHRALETRASAIPRSGGRLDSADVWLGTLARGNILLRGTDVVRAGFPGLDAGLMAAERRADAPFTAHHGRLEARAGLDPRNNPAIVVSAGRLETLGTCPLRYLMRYVLRIAPPDTTDWVADRWLTPLERGRLLHRIYERTLRQVRSRGQDVAGPGFEPIALEVLERALEREREDSPPPGDAVYAVEAELLREDVLAFVQVTRAMGAPWEHLEQRFGRSRSGEADAVRIGLPGGDILVSGAIDRIDRAATGLVVIDYKTGSAEPFGRPYAVFHGGRRLQHALYSAVTRRLFGDVVRAEYHFPTVRGETRVSRFEETELRRARRIIDALLGLTAAGHFHPTNEPADCRYWDYRSVCRVREQAGRLQSPLAEWAQRTDAAELWVMRRLRDPMV